MEMKATHSLHSKFDGHTVFLLHDNGAGQVHYKISDNGIWRLAWYPEAAAARGAFDVRKINRFKGNK